MVMSASAETPLGSGNLEVFPVNTSVVKQDKLWLLTASLEWSNERLWGFLVGPALTLYWALSRDQELPPPAPAPPLPQLLGLQAPSASVALIILRSHLCCFFCESFVELYSQEHLRERGTKHSLHPFLASIP